MSSQTGGTLEAGAAGERRTVPDEPGAPEPAPGPDAEAVQPRALRDFATLGTGTPMNEG